MTCGVPADRFSVVVLGYGLGGRVFHAPLVSAEPRLSLDGIVTRDPERAAQALERYPDARVYSSADEAFEAGHDLAVISTANVTHVEFARAAIAAGMHVVLDKPIAATFDEAEGLRNVADAAGRLLIPFHNRRWDSDIRTAQAVRDGGVLGHLHRFESRIVKMQVAPKAGWRMSGAPAEMGGLLYDLGVHAIDQAMQLMGPVSRVTAWARQVRPGVHVDDDSTMVLSHTSGALSLLTVSQVEGLDGLRMQLFGTRGALRIAVPDSQEAELAGGADPAAEGFGTRHPGTEALLRTYDADGHASDAKLALQPGAWPVFYRQVAAALAGQGPPPVTVADALQTTRVLDAARLSAREARSVTLEPPAAHA